MIKNYFKIAWRNLIKNKGYSAINIVGLAVGMAVALLLTLWVYDELSFNKSFQNSDRIALVMQNKQSNSGIETWPLTPYPLADALRSEYGSSFKQVVLATATWPHLLNTGSKKLSPTGTYFEPGVTKMLNLKMLSGSENGLQDQNSVLLSNLVAASLFGKTNPIGQIIKMDNKTPVKVAGVYQALPLNSAFADVQFIAPWKLYYSNTDWIRTAEDPWRPNAFFTYIELAANADLEKVSTQIKDVRLKHVNQNLAKQNPQLFLQPMRKWHLYNEFKNGVNTGGRIQYVWLFGLIGAFVLFLACINFMNLSTARSEKRAKEVGIRKTIGSSRQQLTNQFFAESLLFVFLAFFVSLILVQFSLPVFNQVAGKETHILWTNPYFWLSSLTFCLLTGIIAGLYPALYLSSFEPIKVLKGTFRLGRSAATPRQVLVVVQFTVSIVLIIGTIAVFRQIQFAKNRPVGYNRNGLVMIGMPSAEMHNHFEAVKTVLKNEGAIVDMTESEGAVTNINSTNTGFDWKGKDPSLPTEFPKTDVSFDYGKTIGLQFLAGRDFSKDFASDSSAVIINEAAAKLMQMKHPVGETITWDGHPIQIIGVVKDVVMESPYAPVRPSIFNLLTEPGSVLIARINPKRSASEALQQIEKVYKTYNPEQPFDYKFVDEDYNRKFGDEERIGKLAGGFAALAIFISCLGLFGMASFVAEQRRKEIGVRKVLGASVFNLWQMLSKDFVQLVFLSLLIATPIAWLFLHYWLQQYAYHASISIWVFAIAGFGAIGITLLTVSFQAIKAALANPVKSLRSE
ncbi:ABC transporter permease [uncultured Mucilaginibacter sp.]|uniref:ABC transporter permease n=1 Tax=uncultured Mucilaginibacter sp. TaxID=797541 RepID=UPI00260BC6DC|nr:ABC transporter permease [uncultured Mucilaginibacter sp.]